MRLEPFDSAAVMAQVAAEAVAERLAEAIAARSRASLVATGGRSPGPVYDRLRAAEIDWSRVSVTLSDERCVPPDAPESNIRQVRERLLAGPASRAAILPLWPEPTEEDLQALLPFDAVLLGMGEDGHVASLIPGDPGLGVSMDPKGGRLTAPVPAGLGSPPVARITLTLGALLQSRAIFLLIAGEAKREVVARAEGGADLPVRALLAQAAVPVRVLWAPTHSD